MSRVFNFRRIFSFFFLCFMLLTGIFPLLADDAIPESLSPWGPWVLKGSEALQCPFINRTDFSELGNHVCAWPGGLTLEATENAAGFEQSWQVLSKTLVPLPGDDKNWPLKVRVNDKELPVFKHNGRPSLELTPGNYLIKGQFHWQRLPESLAVPGLYGQVELTVNNRAVAFPRLEQNELWLRQLDIRREQQDSLDISVARRITDGAYIKLETFISIRVSGKMREVKLGKVLPAGFELSGIRSKVGAFLGAGGILYAKLQPGSWEILVDAYARPELLTWQKPEQNFALAQGQSYHWPQDEIWVFRGQENLRLGKLKGAQMIDTRQGIMPQPWYELPGYLMQEGDSLSYEVQHRGKPLHLENRLHLSRDLWLAFDNASYNFSDKISGYMIADWRLSMPAPFMLESAEDQDGPVLITTRQPGERGVENRYPRVEVQARGIAQARSQLAVTGWDSDFEQVDLTLNLPPLNLLFAVFGADYVSSSWWSNWSIWASFILLLSAILAARLVNISAGITTGLMLLVIYQEVNAPVIAIINLLLALAIKKYQPFARLQSLVKTYWVLSVALIVTSLLFFCAVQLRMVLYPQLDSGNTAGRIMKVEQNLTLEHELAGQTQAEEGKQHKRMMRSPQEPMPAEMADMEDVERLVVTGNKFKSADLLMERYQSDALMQAGAGIPNWQWRSHQVNWSSPVAKGQVFDLIVLSKNQYRLLKVVGVVLSLLWLYLVLKDVVRITPGRLQPKAAAALLAFVMLLPGYSPELAAESFPDQVLLAQLKARLSEAPLCAPDCVVISQMQLEAQAKMLTLKLAVDAGANTALALPRSEFWRPQSTKVNGKTVSALIKRRGWIYIPVQQGITHIQLSGQLAPVEAFQLEFKDKALSIELLPSSDWEIIGTLGKRLSANTLEFLARRPLKSGTEQTSSRYSKQPLVKVIRELSIDKVWRVSTRVERIAPSQGSITVWVPILPGERISSDDIVFDNHNGENRVQVSLASGQQDFSWQAMLAQQENISFHARSNNRVIEVWQVLVSPSWHAEFSGLPVIFQDQDHDDYFRYAFSPYGDEVLHIRTTRPEAVAGDVLAIDRVEYNIEQGSRTATLNLTFDYRSTRGGEHVITLPQDYQLKEVSSDGKIINLQGEAGKLALPVFPGKHKVNIRMRAASEQTLMMSSPAIDLNAPVSNMSTNMNLSRERWLLSASGPLLGPAVLYWGELLVFLLLALLLSRVKFSPLTTISWLVLGLGLSLHNWGMLMLITFWFASLTASTYRPETMRRLFFNLSQLGLYGLSVVVLLSLVAVVPMSLLGTPDMGISGNYSYGNHLSWFADKSDGLLPEVSVVTISTLFYKGIMLGWVIWLSFAIVGWVKWAWQMLGSQGYWRSKASIEPLEVKSK
ncbi:hypothetical protein [Thalassomonas haliotis]|uniref:Uncharacterized protein n=1 Tax=Thalassomonas haliotis TaxID=485448 RepID=A0ABY7VCI9_9GAMM|nr:hypothetical protein [Thalassomonas haliotis]WDE10617.1 hypothetical protein H3N35_20505 [Thalassomonas haliotis]